MEVREDRTVTGILVVQPVGRIDSVTSESLEETLLERVAAGETRMVVDLASVKYISSAGLRVLLTLAKKLRGRGQVVLCAMVPAVREVFELAGFLPLFAIEASRDQAVARVVSGG
jgi:anti-anti-sigma factor